MTTTKTVAGHVVPAGISADLADGIRRYAAAIADLGGYGTRVRTTMPNGIAREGRLIELGCGGCQPGLQTDDGRRYAIRDLATVEVSR